MKHQVVEVQHIDHQGQTITLYRIHDELHGRFWGWIIGAHIELATWRHHSICFDVARSYIDGRQR